MAKWMPIISGALKGAAQKLISVFTKNRTEAESGESKDVGELTKAKPDPDLPDFPEESAPKIQSMPTPKPDESIAQSREERYPDPVNSTTGAEAKEYSDSPGAVPRSEPLPIPGGPTDSKISKEPFEYDDQNTKATPSSDNEVAKEDSKAESEVKPPDKLELPESEPAPTEDLRLPEIASQRENSSEPVVSTSATNQASPIPELTTPQQSPRSLPDLPEWPKAVMEASGMSNGSNFGPAGNLAAPPPPLGTQGPVTQEPPQQPPQQSAPIQPQGMQAAEQVVKGYTRTDKLLELMMLRGIPSLKPPRGP